MGGSVKRFISLACFKSLQPSLHELSNVELVTESQANHGEIPCLWLFVFLRSITMADRKEGQFQNCQPRFGDPSNHAGLSQSGSLLGNFPGSSLTSSKLIAPSLTAPRILLCFYGFSPSHFSLPCAWWVPGEMIVSWSLDLKGILEIPSQIFLLQ